MKILIILGKMIFLKFEPYYFDNPNIIDHYISENPEHLTTCCELTIINDFKADFIDDFLILTNLDDYTIVPVMKLFMPFMEALLIIQRNLS